jgi:hypothetical protein
MSATTEANPVANPQPTTDQDPDTLPNTRLPAPAAAGRILYQAPVEFRKLFQGVLVAKITARSTCISTAFPSLRLSFLHALQDI